MSDEFDDQAPRGEEAPKLKPHMVMVGGQPMTTSVAVAKHFDKRHGDVLRAIRQILDQVPAEYHQRNFASMMVLSNRGKGAQVEESAFRMTRDGFVLVAMGFIGQKALNWKIAYIEAFNRMEEALSQRQGMRIAEAEALEARWPIWKEYMEGIEAKVEEQQKALADQQKELRRLQYRLENVNNTMTGPEELGVAMAVTGMNAAAAVVLNLLTRASYEREGTPEFTTWSMRQIGNVLRWPKMGQIRTALNMLQRDGLVQVVPGKSKTSARRYRVIETRVVEALKQALTGQPNTPASLVLVNNSLSPLAPHVRKVLRVDEPMSQKELDEIADLRDGPDFFRMRLH